MKGIKSNHRRQKGFTLLYVLCFLFLALGLVLSILPLTSNHRKIAQQQVDLERAMYVAEAGMEFGTRLLQSNSSSTATLVVTNNSIGPGSFSCMITQLTRNSYTIVSTGTVNNVSRVVSLQYVSRPTYAEFSLWTATNGAIYYTVGDVFYGHVHADDAMYFANPGGTNGPIFHDYCDSGTNFYYSRTGSSAVKNGSTNGITFDKGFKLNTYQGTMADVNFNDPAKPDELLAYAQDPSTNGLVLQGFTTITFNGGTMSISNDRQYWTNHSYAINYDQLLYIQNATSGTASTRGGQAYLLGGYVTGRLTLVTESNMVISGHIRYTNDPRVNTNSTDGLGLISHDYIMVATNAPNNLEIDAEMMAVGNPKPPGDGSAGSFTVINYDDSTNPKQGYRGLLNLYGGIVQNQRGAVGTIDGNGNVVTGYRKNYSYDSRFIDAPPPFYPTIRRILRWSNWRERAN
jgi:Tfp pilus assembly protein PilX